MVVKLFNKPRTQRLIRNLRSVGWPVEKTNSGIYELKVQDKLLFAAMPGTRGYLVRFDPDFLIEL